MPNFSSTAAPKSTTLDDIDCLLSYTRTRVRAMSAAQARVAYHFLRFNSVYIVFTVALVAPPPYNVPDEVRWIFH
jgi:hypothetical protein